eukprot:CAMPEP_0173387602 /NCGR_PEP_ID=MMETSP1356-20130122/10077_1 /TAXON_ID=77927 ORGANISM="Hemiselmis virescens, Strain PCC157" /NCGR_SAMPLE_ID=MMETSP1356 /ASSEMBLY_ACC=CAM_ASM_000847 /LENGTH=250 /DNA_ID=CAMNT_0014344271 /DNA_START=61 /DNA_END=813 /DNA_ORIENTATION=+
MSRVPSWASSSEGSICRRRSSVTNTELDVIQAISEAFASLDKDGSGTLSVHEIEVGLKRLMILNDPRNDTDSICAALDINGDGQIHPEEFHSYIHPTVDSYASSGKYLDVQDIMKEAFQATIAEGRRSRDEVIQGFMQAAAQTADAHSKQAGWAMPLNKKWMHKLYDDIYDSPDSPDAPRYKHQRGGQYVVRRLDELQDSHLPTLKAKRAREAYLSKIGCPDQNALSKFCTAWQGKISAYRFACAGPMEV